MTPNSDSKHYYDLDRQRLSREQLAQKKGQLFFKRSIIITLIGSVLVMLGLLLSVTLFPVTSVIGTIDNAAPWLGWWRVLLFALLIGGWPRWADCYRSWGYLDELQFQNLLQLRWRMAVWLIILELVFNQHILGDFLNTFII
jgi:hypothetical protein